MSFNLVHKVHASKKIKSLSCQSKPPYKCSLENMYPILKDMGEITSFVFEDKKLDFHINKKGKIYRLIVLTR